MKKLFSLLFVALLSMTAWGTTVTFEAGTTMGSNTSATSADSMTKDGVTISTTKGAFAAAQYRFAASSTTTVSSTVGNITKVEFTSTASYGSQYGPDLFSGDGYSAQSGSKVGTWIGNAESFSLTATAQVRCSQIVVTIADPAVEELVAPVFTPGDGTEFDVASLAVTVSCATPDADIYVYNVVDGEIDWAGGYQYFHESGQIYVTQTSSYAAYSTKGSDYSDYVYATYTKVQPTCAAPVFTPGTGATFEDELDVTISCATEGATITYTVNDDINEGIAPVVVTLTESATITAVASCDGYKDSQEVSASYTYLPPFTVGGIVEFVALTDTVEGGSTAGWHTIVKDGVTMKFYGTVSNYATVDQQTGDTTAVFHQYRIYKNNTIQFTTSAGNIRKIEFVCDPTNPVNGFNEVPGLNYATGIWEGTTRDITFTAGSKQVRANSIIVTLDDDVPAIVVADPVLNPETNTKFVNNQLVTITCETTEATIYYSTDGENYVEYAAPFTITESCTVQAYAELEGVQSNIVSAKYIKLVEVSTLAEANDLDNKTDFIFYGNVVTVYQYGSNLWVKDDTGYGLIYGNQVPSGIQDGSTLKEEWDAQYTLFRGQINEYQYPNNVVVDDEVELVEIVPTEYTEAEITTDVINERVLVKGLTLTTGEGGEKYLYTADGMVIYNQFNITYPAELEGKTFDVEGMVSYYNEKVQIMPIAITEVQDDYMRGDIDMNGSVGITDVTALINYLLTEDATGIDLRAADCDQNQTIGITDVTALINYLLTGEWGE